MKPGRSRRDFIRRTLFGGAIAALVSRTSSMGADRTAQVDRRKLGRTGAEVSILGLGLGAAFMDAFENRLEAGHALLESALARGINYWDTARGYGPSEGMIAPVLVRNRSRVFLASKSDSRDYEGFKRDLERSLQVLQTNYIDLYQLHDLGPQELNDLDAIEAGAIRAAREAKEQKLIRAFGVTGHSHRGILIACMRRFNPDTVLTTFLATESGKGAYEELLSVARAQQMGVIAMKTIRYGRRTNLPPPDLLRYALSLNGVHTAIVGLDSLNHLNEDAAVATGFRALKAANRYEFRQNASRALAGLVPPWEMPGYVDRRDKS
ncbi:MAG: aldo/keto reductase [Verrucomicrobia bacterium]|nr:aldo/keto reductase [Verrucomicrobiota bacterium]